MAKVVLPSICVFDIEATVDSEGAFINFGVVINDGFVLQWCQHSFWPEQSIVGPRLCGDSEKKLRNYFQTLGHMRWCFSFKSPVGLSMEQWPSRNVQRTRHSSDRCSRVSLGCLHVSGCQWLGDSVAGREWFLVHDSAPLVTACGVWRQLMSKPVIHKWLLGVQSVCKVTVLYASWARCFWRRVDTLRRWSKLS